jgi:DNA-binding transcriptional MerR regulator
MKLEDFINKNNPKKKSSVFDEYLEDIKTLLNLNYSQKQIIEYLKLKPNNKNKPGISEANLSSYLKKVRKLNKLDTVEEKKEVIIENNLNEKYEEKVNEKRNKVKDPFANLKS